MKYNKIYTLFCQTYLDGLVLMVPFLTAGITRVVPPLLLQPVFWGSFLLDFGLYLWNIHIQLKVHKRGQAPTSGKKPWCPGNQCPFLTAHYKNLLHHSLLSFDIMINALFSHLCNLLSTENHVWNSWNTFCNVWRMSAWMRRTSSAHTMPRQHCFMHVLPEWRTASGQTVSSATASSNFSGTLSKIWGPASFPTSSSPPKICSMALTRKNASA